MADDKSSGEKHTASEEAFFIRGKIVERNLDYCRSLTPIQVDTVIDLYKEHDKDSNPLSLKISADVSDALKGLKAVQREAKKATAALKELEEQKNKDKYLTIELDELGDVPKVMYKGKEITAKEFINFQWTTKSEVPGNTDVIVDYYEDSLSKSIREGVSS